MLGSPVWRTRRRNLKLCNQCRSLVDNALGTPNYKFKMAHKTDEFRVSKDQICRKYHDGAKVCKVCRQRAGSTTQLDHIIELQLIVKALNSLNSRPNVYIRNITEDVCIVSNSVKNLQRLSAKNNQSKNGVINSWLATSPPESAKKHFGATSKRFREMRDAWKKLKPDFKEKGLSRLANTIDGMIHGVRASKKKHRPKK